MLKGIPNIISPELLKILMEMGHNDEIVIGDGNFPGQSLSTRCVRCDGHGVVDMLKAILTLMPLDTYAQPTYIIDKGDDPVETPIWDEFEAVLKEHTDAKMMPIDRYEFYERTKKAYATVMTGETALYGCIILKKGVIA